MWVREWVAVSDELVTNPYVQCVYPVKCKLVPSWKESKVEN